MSKKQKREELIRKKIEAEENAERLATGDARAIIYEFLVKNKGYRPEDMAADVEFAIDTEKNSDTASVDYIVTLEGRRYMAIKCTMALDSRERHVLSFCRVADTVQIPYAVITDGIKAYLLETETGRRLSEEMDDIPSRGEAVEGLEGLVLCACPPERVGMEKRILLAFEFASCPKIKP